MIPRLPTDDQAKAKAKVYRMAKRRNGSLKIRPTAPKMRRLQTKNKTSSVALSTDDSNCVKLRASKGSGRNITVKKACGYSSGEFGIVTSISEPP
jgi:hypothetical protein